MVPFDMSVDARMMLTRMSLIYEKERGSRIRMSRDEEVITLINYAVDSINDELYKQYELFRKLLQPSEVKALAAQGANIYRGAVVSEVSDEVQPEMTPGVRMYRGTAVAGESKPKPTSHMQPAETPATSGGKGKRVYRGRVIEE